MRGVHMKTLTILLIALWFALANFKTDPLGVKRFFISEKSYQVTAYASQGAQIDIEREDGCEQDVVKISREICENADSHYSICKCIINNESVESKILEKINNTYNSMN